MNDIYEEVLKIRVLQYKNSIADLELLILKYKQEIQKLESRLPKELDREYQYSIDGKNWVSGSDTTDRGPINPSDWLFRRTINPKTGEILEERIA